MMENQQLLFSIGQTGVLSEINENSFQDKEIIIYFSENKCKIDQVEKINQDYSKRNIFTQQINFQNSHIFTSIFDVSQNSLNQQFYQNVQNNSHLNQFKNNINSLSDDQIAIIQFCNHNGNYQISEEWYSYIKNDLTQNCIIDQRQLINCQNYSFIFIIQGKTKKILAEQFSLINPIECMLTYQYNNIEDFGNSNHGKNLIPPDKVDFQTQLERTIISEFELDRQNNYLIFQGLIQKNMNISQIHSDAEIVIEYLNDNNEVIQEDKNKTQQQFRYRDLILQQKINKLAKKARIILYCKNAITIPELLYCKNFQCYYQLSDYEFKQNTDENFLTSIDKSGIQTNSYQEGVGFNPRNFDDYVKEYNQNKNLLRDVTLPIIVEEPIKIYDKIIDNNKHRIVNKVNEESSNITLPSITIDNHKSYIFGVWISNKENLTNTRLFLKQQNQLLDFRYGRILEENREIMIDRQKNLQDNKDFHFYYGIIYPYGQKGNNDSLKNISKKIDDSLLEIQIDHHNTSKRLLTQVQPGNSEITLIVKNTNNQQKKINNILVMPIFKELQIFQIEKNRLVQMDLEEISRRN